MAEATRDRRLAKPWRRDVADLTARLGDWARGELGRDAVVQDAVIPDNGNSADTMLFDVHVDGGIDRLVAKLAPLPESIPVFEDVDVVRQARLMGLIGEQTAVPVPTVRAVIPDPDVLGTPFLVMVRAEGRAPSDTPPYVLGGWVHELSADERALMQHHAVSLLAQIHEVTPAVADLSFVGPVVEGTDALDEHLSAQWSYYDWVRGELRVPLVEQMLGWLAANRPSQTGPTVLNWGDARIGNVLWDGPEPTAVLDWEMASLGPGEFDLGWSINQHRFFQGIATSAGVPGLPDFLQRDDVAEAYGRLRGRRVADLEWFEVFAALRLAIITVRTKLREIAFGTATMPGDRNDLVAFRAHCERMVAGTYWD